MLKPLAGALADGDPIHAVIRGTAVNQDGRTQRPDRAEPAAQEARAAPRPTRRAGSTRQRSSTSRRTAPARSLGDPIEAQGAGHGPGDEASARAARRLIGSVKTNIGHLEAAAGRPG